MKIKLSDLRRITQALESIPDSYIGTEIYTVPIVHRVSMTIQKYKPESEEPYISVEVKWDFSDREWKVNVPNELGY